MESIEKYLLYILLAAVAVLYGIQFSGTPEMEAEVVSDSLSVEDVVQKNSQIYYVNTDTIWAKYQYVQDAFDELSKRKDQYENTLEKKYADFEREVSQYQQNGATMGEMELQIKQRDLMRKEGELAKMREEYELKIMQEDKTWNDKLRADVVSYIDEFTSDRDYDYILGYSITSNIILANDSLDLTNDILKGLNEKYAAREKK